MENDRHAIMEKGLFVKIKTNNNNNNKLCIYMLYVYNMFCLLCILA